jgi:hypothetical protein
LEGSGRGLIEALSPNFPGGAEENHENPTVRIAGVPAKIRIQRLMNTRSEHRSYAASLFGKEDGNVKSPGFN